MVGKKVKKALHNPETATIILLVIMVVFVASLQSNFFYSATVKNNIVSWTPLILLAMGQDYRWRAGSFLWASNVIDVMCADGNYESG